MAIPDILRAPILQAKRGGRGDFYQIKIIKFLKRNCRFGQAFWILVINRKVPPRFLELNRKAFESGYGFKP